MLILSSLRASPKLGHYLKKIDPTQKNIRILGTNQGAHEMFVKQKKTDYFLIYSKFETWLILYSLNHKLIGEGRGERRKLHTTRERKLPQSLAYLLH